MASTANKQNNISNRRKLNLFLKIFNKIKPAYVKLDFTLSDRSMNNLLRSKVKRSYGNVIFPVSFRFNES